MAGDSLRHRRLSLASGRGAHWPGTELAVGGCPWPVGVAPWRARGPVSRGASGWLATTSGTGGCRWPSGCVRADLSQEEPADGWRQPPAPEAVPSQWVWPPGVRADLSQEEPADGWRQPPAPEALLRNVPSRSYPFGGTQLHGTHTLGHFSGRVWCFTCACSFSVTGPRVPPSLLGPCTGHTTEDTAKRNVYCLAKGELPAAWRAGGWPLGPDAGMLHFAA